jgi:quercetin dioxygenase-like cupin family protein
MLRTHFNRMSVAALLLAGFLIGGFASAALAQDATPAAGPIAVTEVAPGVTAEVLAAAPSAVAPGQTAYVARFIFQSGAEIFPHGHPGTTVLGVLSGSFGWTLVEGTAHVVRGAGSGGTTVEDITETGSEVILEPGDAIYYEDDVVHTASGAGDSEAVVLATLVLETGAPLLMTADEMAGMDHGATPES